VARYVPLCSSTSAACRPTSVEFDSVTFLHISRGVRTIRLRCLKQARVNFLSRVAHMGTARAFVPTTPHGPNQADSDATGLAICHGSGPGPGAIIACGAIDALTPFTQIGDWFIRKTVDGHRRSTLFLTQRQIPHRQSLTRQTRAGAVVLLQFAKCRDQPLVNADLPNRHRETVNCALGQLAWTAVTSGPDLEASAQAFRG